MSRYTITVDGVSFEVEFKSRVGSRMTFSVNGQECQVEISPTTASPNPSRAIKRPLTERRSVAADVKAPMPGIISEVRVASGTEVKTGDILVVIEAMKMENPLKATADAVVEAIFVQQGQEVSAGQVLVTWRK